MIDRALDILMEWPTKELIETYLWLCVIAGDIGWTTGHLLRTIH